jgi:hypothetical protein
MVRSVEIGMDKAETQTILAKAKRESVNLACGLAAEAGYAVLLLHKAKAPPALEKQLKQRFPDAKGFGFATAEVDPEDDSKLVRVRVNKTAGATLTALAAAVR